VTRRNIFHSAVAAMVAASSRKGNATAKPEVIVRHPPMVRQEELRRALDLQNQANAFAFDIASRIEAGADFERGALGVSNFGTDSAKEWVSASGVIQKHVCFFGLEIAPVEKLEYQEDLLAQSAWAKEQHYYVLR
jgi:hypothetical protein